MFDYKKITVVSNRHLCQRPFDEQIRRVCELQPAGIILREKDLDEADYTALAEMVLPICEAAGVPLIIHTYPEAARALGISRIHMPLPLLRSCSQAGDPHSLDDFKIIGCSTHSLAEAQEAIALGADYLTAGHIFTTDCKKGLAPRGLSFLREVCQASPLPVHAIGGISFDEEQIRQVLECGAAGVCIMSAAMRI